MQITMGKKYQTLDGRAVRILCVDRGLRWPVLGLVANKNGDESVGTWDACGMQEFNENQNLMPVPTKHEGWILVSRGGQILGANTSHDIIALESQPFRGETVHKIVWED